MAHVLSNLTMPEIEKILTSKSNISEQVAITASTDASEELCDGLLHPGIAVSQR